MSLSSSWTSRPQKRSEPRPHSSGPEKLPKKLFPEIDPHDAAKVGEPQGVPAAKMSEPQRATLDKLIHAYIDRLPGDVAQSELDRIRRAQAKSPLGPSKFAITGSGMERLRKP